MIFSRVRTARPSWWADRVTAPARFKDMCLDASDHQALADFRAAAAANSATSAAYQGIGLVQRKLGNDSAAITAFATYLRLAPHAPDHAELRAWMRTHGG